MQEVCTKMVPKPLSVDQMEQRVIVCRDLLEQIVEGQEFPGGDITGDETWVLTYVPKTKKQNV